MNVITNDNFKCSIALVVLRDVIDPEIYLSVVDLGLIYQVDFDEEYRNIFVRMTLTTQFCPMGDSIVCAVTHALENSFPEYTVRTTLTFTPPWKNTMISEIGQEYLNK